jgi:hypothetical protein
MLKDEIMKVLIKKDQKNSCQPAKFVTRVIKLS